MTQAVQQSNAESGEPAAVAQLLAEFQAEIARLEGDPSIAWFHRAQSFFGLWQRANAAGFQDVAALRPIYYEFLLWDLVARFPQSGARRGARWKARIITGDGADGASFEHVADQNELFAYARRRTQESAARVHRARYADVLWELKGDNQCARVAARAYLDCVSPWTESDSPLARNDAIARALQIGLQIDDDELIAAGKRAVLELLQAAPGKSPACDANPLLPWLLKLRNRHVERVELEAASDYLRRAAVRYASQGGIAFFWERTALKVVADFCRRLGNAAGDRAAKLAIGESLERQAQERSGEPVNASAFLTDAYNYYQAQHFNDEARALKPRVEAAQRNVLQQFGRIAVPITLDFEAVDALGAALANMPPAQSLAHVATATPKLPHRDQLHTLALENLKTYLHLALGGRRTYSHDGRQIGSASTDDERLRAHLFELCGWHAQTMGISHARLFRGLMDSGRWTADTITDFLGSGVVFDADKLPILRTGLERYIARDYFSALSVLVPLLEDALRRVIGKLGLPTIGNPDPISHEIALHAVLKTDRLRAGLGEDFCFWCEFLFTEDLGFNLRNDIAHGLLPFERAREPVAALVLDVLLHLQPVALMPIPASGAREIAVHWVDAAPEPAADGRGVQVEMTPEAWIRVVTDRIVREFHPLRVLLFGSYARGEAGPDSDVDVLVILSLAADRRATQIEIGKALADIPVPKDVLVADPLEIQEHGDEPSGVLYAALRDGRVLYERPEFPVDRLIDAGE